MPNLCPGLEEPPRIDWHESVSCYHHDWCNRKLKEDIYMKQSRGFKWYSTSGTLLVCHLLSFLYGLKQAALNWYELLSSVLLTLRFIKCKVDPAVFTYDRAALGRHHVVCIIAWHVDNGLGGSNNWVFLDWVKGRIKDRFGISDMGPVLLYLGIEIEWDHVTHKAWIHQETYIWYLCKEYGFSDCSPVSTIMNPHHPFGCDDDSFLDIPALEHAYCKIVRELIYLLTCTCSDIAFTIRHLVQ